MMRSSRFATRGVCLSLYGLALITVSGCTLLTTDNRDIDYGANIKRVKTLEIPPDLTAPEADERYKIPQSETASTYSSYSKNASAQVNSASAVLPELQSVRLERNGTQRWLVVNDKPENVWAAIKLFWQEIGLTIASEDQAAGIMETDWAENRARIPQSSLRKLVGKVFNNAYSTNQLDQYLIRLERSKDGKNTEIYVTYRSKEEVLSADKTSSRWITRSGDTETEAIMLQRLMVRLGASEIQARNAVRSSQPAAPAEAVPPHPTETASLHELADGKTIILINDSFDRAWRLAGLAIEAAGLSIEDQNRDKGIYFLHSGKAQRSLADKLKFWKNTKDADKLYQVNVKESGSTSEISVTDRDNLHNKTSRQILELIYKYIEQK